MLSNGCSVGRASWDAWRTRGSSGCVCIQRVGNTWGPCPNPVLPACHPARNGRGPSASRSAAARAVCHLRRLVCRPAAGAGRPSATSVSSERLKDPPPPMSWSSISMPALSACACGRQGRRGACGRGVVGVGARARRPAAAPVVTRNAMVPAAQQPPKKQRYTSQQACILSPPHGR